MKTLFIAAIVLVGLVSYGAAVKCYVCAACNDPYTGSNSDEYDCGNATTHCSKVKTTVSGVSAVARSCGTSGTTCSSASLAGISTDTCNCEGELCNGVAGVASSLVVMLVAAAVPLSVLTF